MSASTPDLRWKTLDAAQSLAAQRSLRVEVAGSRSSDAYAANAVIEQYRPPGQRVSRNDVIWVVISKGREAVVVPNLNSRSLEEASVLVARARLGIGRITAANDWSEWGTVLSQQPRPGTRVAPGTVINVLISKGPGFCKSFPGARRARPQKGRAVSATSGLGNERASKRIGGMIPRGPR